MSFYYWHPGFGLDSLQDTTLRRNGVRTLYIRYFDVDWLPADSAPVSLFTTDYRNAAPTGDVIPVISIRDRVFDRLTPATIPGFAAGIFSRVRSINASRRLQNREIQFDCDWSEKSQRNYFFFLQEYHRISVQAVSAAIRMNQLRYPDRAGIPPVDYGVLFYFNLQETDTGDVQSLFERPVAHRFTPSLRSYPLTLDIALPLFGSGKSRDGEELFDIISDVNRHSNHHIRNLIFFNLDDRNLLRYDPRVFKEALARVD
ncbi:MAG TPA: hypothetical protein VKU83_11090 [Puia sp.]|nr:hypothetical protein [Puia sp.]